jgi:hypothetical protein
VFHAPALSALSTPNIAATPAVFKNGYYPWAVKTPEVSPMCWNKEPPRLGRSEEPVVSRDLLRRVCEPFFEQMLTALQEALEEQQKRQSEEHTRNVRATTQCQSFLPLQRILDPTPDEESTDVEGFGAFASLLSGPSSSPSASEKSDIAVVAKTSEFSAVTFSQPLAETLIKEEPDQGSDQDKSAMVCRHWKSKGWCRMESKCKFQHPEHKRGVAGPKAGGGSSTNRGDISGADCPVIRTTLSLTDALSNEGRAPVAPTAALKKKKSKVRSAKGSTEDMLRLAPTFNDVRCTPCIDSVQCFAGSGTSLQ